MKQLRHVLFMLALGSASAFGGDLPSSSSACEPGAIAPRSWDLVTRAQALNVLDTLDEIKVALHGRTGELEVYKPVGEDHLAMRGRGPATYQDLVRRMMVKFVDPERRIALPPSHPGVGW
jgi:hypothetical protein